MVVSRCACFRELKSTDLEILHTQPDVLDMHPKGPKVFCKVYVRGSLKCGPQDGSTSSTLDPGIKVRSET